MDIKEWEQKVKRGIKRGESHSFRLLYKRFYSGLCKFAYRYTSRSEIAEEIVQDIFLKLWQDRKEIDIHGSIHSYSQKTTFNLNHEKIRVGYVLLEIEKSSDYKFLYPTDLIDANRTVNLYTMDTELEDLLDMIFTSEDASFRFFEDNLVAITKNPDTEQQQLTVTGRVTDAATGESLPGVSVFVEGTTNGTATDNDGNYSWRSILYGTNKIEF